jgi:hypothetical protein
MVDATNTDLHFHQILSPAKVNPFLTGSNFP